MTNADLLSLKHMTPWGPAGSARGWPLVLYFHHVSSSIDHYTSISFSDFERGIETVLGRFHPLDPYDACADVPPRHPTFLLTFDDGYRDVLDAAVPFLDTLSVRAVFFVTTANLGNRSDNAREDYLAWDECESLQANGHLVASHGVTHRPMDELSPADRSVEVAQSVAAIESAFGHGDVPYAYPYGRVASIPPACAPKRAFGTSRSLGRPWDAQPHSVRRSFLPVDGIDQWGKLTDHWLENWKNGYAPDE